MLINCLLWQIYEYIPKNTEQKMIKNVNSNLKQKSPEDIVSPGLEIKVAASYSPALHCSTIGAGGLNFSVRNGKRWDPAAITT